MLDCPRMPHRVHTVLSLLAEDHAPSALRPSILLAVDWPTVAEEAPAAAADEDTATIAAAILGGSYGAPHSTIPAATRCTVTSLAARLATVAASLAATGDKAMTTHAAALWGAAAALVGMPTAQARATNIDPSTADVYLHALAHKANGLMFGMSSTPAQQAAIIGTVLDKIKAHEFADHEQRRAAHDRIIAALNALASKAADLVPGAKCSTPNEQATLIATALDRVSAVETERVSLQVLLGKARSERDTARAAHDKALADIHALRDILKVPEGGNLVDHASKTMDGFPRGLLMAAATSAAKITGATMSVYPAEHAGIIGDALRLAESSAAENARLRAQVDRMIAAMREDGFIESSRPR